jgi:arylsulfatase A-like enzyme
MKKKCNILWLMTDEQRTDSLGCYGSPWAGTPNIDSLAHEGVVFENAITPAPACVPARVSIATASMPHDTGCWHNNWHAKQPLDFLTDRCADAGYATAGFGKMHFNAPNKAFQTQEEIILSKHVDYFDYAPEHDESKFSVIKYPGESSRWILGGQFPAQMEETSEHAVATRAIDWLTARNRDQPFFLKVSFNGPHTPVVPPIPYDTAIAEDAITIADSGGPVADGFPEWTQRLITSGYADASRMTAEAIRALRRYYYGYVSFLDMEFGRIIDHLKTEGLMDHTIIAFTSDHGTHLGDFGMFQKQTFFDPVIRVPLVIRFPGDRGGRRMRAPVSTASLLPTLFEAADIPVPSGKLPSLYGAIRSGTEPAAHPVRSEFMYTPEHIRGGNRFIMQRSGAWKLMYREGDFPESGVLLDMRNDGAERGNRIAELPELARMLFAAQ